MDRVLQQLAFWAVIAAVTASALVAGLILRRCAWEETEPIRFTEDINNAFRQGTEAMRIGYFNRYDQAKTFPEWWRSNTHMQLDYAPGRLAVAELWAGWVHRKIDDAPPGDQPVEQWTNEFYDRAKYLHRQYELCAPMLRVNLTGEFLSAIAIFLLTRRYSTSRNRVETDRLLRANLTGAGWALLAWIPAALVLHAYELPLMFSWQLPALIWLWTAFPTHRSTVTGLISALFFWFNPALISNAHCWPQWDSWVMPFFLWGILTASLDCWLISGCVIAAGAMFKGQILFGAPLLLLWPLWQLKILAVVRWLVGLAIAIAVITSGWLVRTAGTLPPSEHFIPGHLNAQAITWIITMAVAFILMVSLLRWRWVWYAKLPVAAVMIGLISWRFFQLDITPQWMTGIWFTLAWIAIVPALLWPVWNPYAKIPAVVVVTVLTTIGLLTCRLGTLRQIDAVLLIAGGFALAESIFQNSSAAGFSWGTFALRGCGVLLGVCVMFISPGRLLGPGLVGVAIVLTGLLLYFCAVNFHDWTWRARLPFGWLLTSLVMWPFLSLTQGLMITAAAETLRVGLIVFYAPRRAIAYTAAGWMAAALLLCIPLFGGGRTWFDIGLASPTTQREAMSSGENDNLANILNDRWEWETMEPVLTLDRGWTADAVAGFLSAVDPKYRHVPSQPVRLPLKYLLVSLWVTALVLSSIGAAIHDRRRGPRFLIAISAPWIALFAVMAQMHQRYLLWGAGLSSASAGLNPGYALLHSMISIIAASQEMQAMFVRDRRFLISTVFKVIQGWHPGIGWAVLLAACIFVYLGLRPNESRNAGIVKTA